MFRWLTQKLTAWVEAKQRQHIARLKNESQRLSSEIEQATGEAFRLQPDELRRLAEKSQNKDPEQVREISILHPEDLDQLLNEIGSAQDRSSKAP